MYIFVTTSTAIKPYIYNILNVKNIYLKRKAGIMSYVDNTLNVNKIYLEHF